MLPNKNELPSRKSARNLKVIAKCDLRPGQTFYDLDFKGKVKKKVKCLSQVEENASCDEIDPEETLQSPGVKDDTNVVQRYRKRQDNRQLSPLDNKKLKSIYKKCHQAIKHSGLVKSKGQLVFNSQGHENSD